MNLIPIESCRACGWQPLFPVLSLGHTPLANALLTAEQLAEPDEKYPLELVFCTRCTLLQLSVTVPPERLFREYPYLSSFSDTMLRNAADIAQRLIVSRGLDKDSLVVEIASNDGYLLRNYHQAGIPVLGIEPALKIARLAEERGVRTLPEFFGRPLAITLAQQGYAADVIHANNVLAHVADLNGVVAGIAAILKPAGVAVVEVPYVKDLLDQGEFDTIYHEHLCYFSLTALERLFGRHGLRVHAVEHLPIHGGSLRLFLGRREASAPAPAVSERLAAEQAWGVERPEAYLDFRTRVECIKTNLVGLLRELKAQGHRLAAYGASAKGTTLLAYTGIGRETLDFVVDRSSVKQGHYTPGTRLPIYAPERLLELMPDYAVLLTWNFADEILKQQAEYRRRGGRFIIPLPELCIV